MKDGLIRVGAVAPRGRVADPMKNAEGLIAAARAAADAGVRVLVTPELGITGYAVSDLFFQAPLIAAAEKGLARYIRETAELDLLSFVGVPVAVGGRLYNCAAAVCRGELLGLVPKLAIPGHGEFLETRHFASAELAAPDEVSYAGFACPFGSELLFACRALPSLVVAAELCEDLMIPVPPSCYHAAAGATLIVNLSASNETVGKAEYRRRLVGVQSAKLLSAYVYANAGEDESGTDLVFSGHHMIAERGRILAEALPFAGGGLISAVVDVDMLLSERRKKNTYPTADAAAYRTVFFSITPRETELKEGPSRSPFIPDDPAERDGRCRLILDMQASALAGRIERAYVKSIVLGISGGLDSTLAILAAARAVDRLGLDRSAIHAVTMPCFGTTARTRSNAERLSEELGVRFSTVDIKAAVAQHFADIGHDPEDLSVVYENAQARERTQVLMDIANAEGGMVLGTGDLSELALGFATYNGDHMSMYGINGGIPKTLIRHLVRYEADRYEAEGRAAVAAVLRDVLATPVSPELLPPKDGEIAQCTEGIVGPYELHDFFLYYFVRFGFAPSKILRLAAAAFSGDYDRETVRAWLRLFIRRFFSQQFKRSCLPDGPKVGSVGFSPRGDFKMPSDASSAAWLAELDSDGEQL